MSTRLKSGGRLIDRSRKIGFTFNGKRLQGYEGDSLAAALLANDQVLMGRSFKYHRPRGVVASGVEEPNALMGIGKDHRFEPNQRATLQELYDGLVSESQNHWPTLDADIGAVNMLMSRFFPAGFYYKTFMAPRAAWKHLFEPVIRKAAGLGKAPEVADADRYEYFYAYTDVLVIGAGMAGLKAAREAAEAGARVLLIEQTAHIGGRLLTDPVEIDGQSSDAWLEAERAALAAMDNVTIRTRMMGAGVYDHGYITAYERVADHVAAPDAPRHRLWRIRADRVITATGAIERPLSFAGNDVPGVMLAAAVRDYVALWGVSPGDRTVIVTNNDDAYRTAIALKQAGLEVPVILDARPAAIGALPRQARELGIRVEVGKGIASVKGGKRVKAVEICAQAGEGSTLETVECDAVAMSGGWSPVVHLWSHCGGKLRWDDAMAHFAPDADRPPTGHDGQGFVIAAGSAMGHLNAAAAMEDAQAAGRRAAAEAGFTPSEGAAPSVNVEDEEPLEAVWMMPAGAGPKLRAKAFLDYQNDVKVADVHLAAQEGFESVEHTKRYTTLGMATDQGKLSNINGLAVLADSLGAPIPAVGTTTFRPPYVPISMGSIAGEARGAIFKPLRKTPMDAWHDANGAHWEPVSDWRRPYTFLRSGESVEQAVTREIKNTRTNVGLLDASTLGKILVKGPDAGKFLDLIYTNMMSTLKVGRCRYGLMCTENGFLFDDGVVVRTGEDEFLCHTTSGGSDGVHAWMEEWLQTEWWDMQVYTANVTEQFAQVAVVGPKARHVLEALGGTDVSKEALSFMGFIDGELGGIPARIHRISFSGELSYEIAVPASYGQAFWDALMKAGEPHGIMPYGTEALHVMRAEKGFIMIGDETDGTVTPHDLALSWAVSKKKEDFIGKRAMERADLTRDNRKQLVGLATEDPATVLPDGAHAVEGKNVYGDPHTIGHVTSTYFSPTLERSIAMALIEGGSQRMGQTLSFPVSADKTIKATVVDPVFFDKDGERQNV
ncbi:sarcosine oxidase subunit alpha family protein [Pontivivens insulae]|uniref:Sarcosine oxidase subunit alpha n=1 Tax=Pontivivens insulae TaxID=1639689 RepID=A0A2R8A9H4_9RHOB|nr:sarcosine oxidase subunit alpha family protein [Pontivivens insulae]RED12806.1 heterotetrameric sarcosine oxidase alpha subunit [Pontivivens insulae]SPF28897.1 Sarcosine oxidase subunit alpha [Pontivivens insulae]